MTNSIFFHEDFYRQIELIPQENYFAILNGSNTDNLDNQSNNGLITITERKEQKKQTEDLYIQFALVKNKLEEFTITEYDIVTTGYGNTIAIRPNTIALGFERIAIFFELNKKEVIKNIWLCQSVDLPQISISNNLLNALVSLGKEYNLILVDWNEEVAVRLSSTNAVMAYLKDNFSFNFRNTEI